MQTYFDQLDRVRYEGPKSANPLAFRHYNPDELVLGKRMEEHLRLRPGYRRRKSPPRRCPPAASAWSASADSATSSRILPPPL